ncbi:MAG: family 43 glycosylhydrolase [Prevotella sp.]|nr:family 43 glycosylhydrolase [Prevotella sp.]
MKKNLLTLVIMLMTFTFAKAADAAAPVINNNTFWKTTSGDYIFSQGGGIFRFPDAQGVEHYYWYGVKYQEAVDYCPKALGGSNSNVTHFISVTCYQSDDLVNWTFVRDVLTSASAGWAYWVGRLGVAYVPEAKKYAMLVQFNDNVLVATCNTPTGNFERHNQIDMTNIIGTPNTGDQTVFTDPDTGKSYLCYSYGKGRSRIYLSEIGVCTDGKIGLKDCHQIYKGSGREGDCMFKYKGKYYVCASDLYGWNASNVYYLEASSIYGPYTPTNSMQKMPGADADYGHVTQTGFFYTVRGTKQETVIYCGDRWAGFAGNGNGFNQWCPISFVNNKPYFNSLSQWHLNAETGEWTVGSENNYVKNFSFDADRVNIPSENKPSQAYLRGWTTEVIKGNKVVIGDAASPVLNAKNSKDDRATVMGNFCMNISDKVDFQRKVYQKIASTVDVPLPNGRYTLSVYAKANSVFSELYMYAKSGDETFRRDIADADGKWHLYTLEDVVVKDNKIEVGFYADGQANVWCHLDDMKLVVTEPEGDQPDGITVARSSGRSASVEYFLPNGQHADGMQRGFNIIRQTDDKGQVTVKKVLGR